MARKLRFAMFGTGFWARYQLHGWYEDKDVECVALYNRTLSKARALADEFHIPHAYDDPRKLLAAGSLDFMDICTNVETHAGFTRLAAEHRLPVVCQKPMATSLEEAREMVLVCAPGGRTAAGQRELALAVSPPPVQAHFGYGRNRYPFPRPRGLHQLLPGL